MKNIKLFEDFLNENLNEANSYALLNKFLEKTLSDEEKGYYWIFTNNVLNGKKLTGNINDNGGHGKSSRSEVEANLKTDKTNVDKKLELLKQAIEEFNKENSSNLQFTYKLNNPKIKTEDYGGRIVYNSESLVASVTIK